jgi:hypothetical protein
MFSSLILGAGPGGMGPLVWAAQNDRLHSWLDDGVGILDRSGGMGGTLGRYAINSDSLGAAYLECLDASAARELFMPLRNDPATRELETMRDGFPRLELVDRYLHRLGDRLQQIVSQHPASRFFSDADISALHLRSGGSVGVQAIRRDGSSLIVEAETAIMALGGRQDKAAYLGAELMPGVRLADSDPDKIMPSDMLMTASGQSHASGILNRASKRRVVILGGSHSAFSAAWVLTSLLTDVRFAAGEIVILLRRSPSIFYETKEAARADGYEVADRDVCPRTRRVNRLGGLRGNGREMWRRLARRPGTAPEERVAMMRLPEPHLSSVSLRQLLDEAALIVPAFGYRMATVPVFDEEGRRLALKADAGGPAVGRDARPLLAEGGRLTNVFGIGLGTDYRPWGAMGGEPSFDGQANSLWLYQNDIGAVVYHGVHECLERADGRNSRSQDGCRIGSLALQPRPGVTECRAATQAAQEDMVHS